jgi:hypothetical protein
MNNQCVVCERNVQRTGNWLRCHLWGAFAIFHWSCFANYLRTAREPPVKGGVSKSSGLAKSN